MVPVPAAKGSLGWHWVFVISFASVWPPLAAPARTIFQPSGPVKLSLWAQQMDGLGPWEGAGITKARKLNISSRCLLQAAHMDFNLPAFTAVPCWALQQEEGKGLKTQCNVVSQSWIKPQALSNPPREDVPGSSTGLRLPCVSSAALTEALAGCRMGTAL